MTLRATIYARKSTADKNSDGDERQDGDELKSVELQVKHCRQFAESRGWTVSDDLIYKDDGISGAEFVNRPGLTALMSRFDDIDILIMTEPSRLGRDTIKTAYWAETIVESDVRIFYSHSGEEENLDTPIAKMMLSFKSCASEIEREKAAPRSRNALRERAEKRYVTGGKVYGYDRKKIFVTGPNGDDKRDHSEYRINKEQADVLRTIFMMYADGHGLVKITKTLNGDDSYTDLSLKYFDGTTPPSPSKGTGTWAPSSIRVMLHNIRYTGKIPYGKTEKYYRRGTKKHRKSDSYIEVDAPELRIIDKKLWNRVQKRLKAAKESYIRNNNGKLWGRPDSGIHSKYLFTGLLRCDNCGASMVSSPMPIGPPGKRRYVNRYACSYATTRGKTVCDVTFRPRMDDFDKVMLDDIIDQLLDPDKVHTALMKARAELRERQKRDPERPAKVRKEITKLKKELARFLGLIANGKAPDAVLAEIERREARIAVLEHELDELTRPVDDSNDDSEKIVQALEQALKEPRELLLSNVPKARQVLRKLFREPLRFKWLGGKSYEVTGVGLPGPLFVSNELAGRWRPQGD